MRFKKFATNGAAGRRGNGARTQRFRDCGSSRTRLSEPLLFSTRLGLLGAVRRYHLVDNPRHQHEETEHYSNP